MNETVEEGSNNKYKYIRDLNSGSQARVVLVESTVSNIQYACKIVSRDQLKNYRVLELFEHEIRIHSFLNHKNIVRLEEVIYSPKNIYMVLEYCANGDLYDYIDAGKARSNLLRAENMVSQLADAVAYLHSKGIYHRDIKPENILLDEEFNVKLCDFGLSSSKDMHSGKDICGTIGYLAPEIEENMPYSAEKADVWMFAQTSLILLYKARETVNSLYMNQACKSQDNLVFISKNDMLPKLLMHCMLSDPNKRPTMKGIVERLMMLKPTHRSIFKSQPIIARPTIKNCKSIYIAKK